jgi:hypothetical protein
MRTIKTQVLAILLIVFSTASCKKDDIHSEIRPGYFVLSEVQKDNPGSRLKSGEADFFLGNLKASREFYFLLSNGGDTPIFNINLQTGDDAFIISPDYIETLPGKIIRDAADPAIIPLLTLGIIHGTQLYGIGFTDLLEMGSKSSKIQISGKTIDGQDTIPLEEEFFIEVFAQLMDIEISYSGNLLDLTKWSGAVSSNLGGLGFVRYYKINTDQIRISNTGNVELTIYYGDEKEIDAKFIVLLPDESGSIDLEDDLVYVKLDADGTITDDRRIQIGNDGNGYLCIHNPELDPGIEPEPVDSTFAIN